MKWELKKDHSMMMGLRIGGRTKPEENLDKLQLFLDKDRVDFFYFLVDERATEEQILSWAEYLAKNQVYFVFSPRREGFFLQEELVLKVREIAGEYFLGGWINEFGSRSAVPKYHPGRYDELQNVKNMLEANQNHIGRIEAMTSQGKKIYGQVMMVEATALIPHCYRAGVDYIITEFMPANPENMAAFSRGMARAYHKEFWGSLIAHEWYGGLRNDDPLKYKRLKLLYDYLYLSGCNLTVLESGEYSIASYGYQYDMNHEFCKTYRKIREEFTDSIKQDERPQEGPLCSVAFVQGNLDGYTGFGCSSIWYQIDREEYSIGDAERSWRILEDMNRSSSWHDTGVFGEMDFSSAPAYGNYDIIPANSPLDVYNRYQYVIFVGWNTMTEEIHKTLKEYVKGGGNLLISAAHYNTSVHRDGEKIFLKDGKLAEFLGCDITGQIRLDSAVKFFDHSKVKGAFYPAPKEYPNQKGDPILPSGLLNLAQVSLTDGAIMAISSDTYTASENPTPMLIEHAYGNGVVAFTTNLDYPGAPQVYPFYRCIAKEWLRASHRECDIHVIASDKVKFSTYQLPDGNHKIYFLNTDYDLSHQAIIRKKQEEYTVSLSPLERKEMLIP